jgi:GT2 family glycosyltransferase|tara:strand:+ start:2318 stop:3241 length:924 start_codon:yes stop_codon:yes gene_type:complete
MNELSIVIVNYKTWDKLAFCLDSILKQIEIEIQVIVVDNNSNDNKFFVFQQKYKWVTWIENSKNYGFAKACNIGIENAKSKWYLFLNPDTILEPKSIHSLINYCNEKTEHRIIGIKQLNENKKNSNSYGLFLNFWSLSGLIRPLIRLKKGSYKSINSKEIANPDWISGSFIMIRKKDFELINGWDESYWMYYEDMDLCKRAKKINLKVSLLNNWSCIHFHGASSRKNTKIKIITKSEVIVSSHIFLEKHSQKSYKFLIHLILILIQFTELSFQSIFSSTKRKILFNSLKYWSGGLLKNVWGSQNIKT